MIRLPGLIDPHVHVREPGATHKEDWDTCTAAALAGGFTMILAMPNTQPPVTDQASLALALDAASSKARCDYAQYLGAGATNIETAASLAPQSAGLKMYLDSTYGPLRLDDPADWLAHLQRWPAGWPVAAHAEGAHVHQVIEMAQAAGRSVHISHVATREEILAIRSAKEAGAAVTCEAAPHHLFLCEEDFPRLPGGRHEVRPRLARRADQAAMLENLAVIDCFATDHAPHTLNEKDAENPPPGFPGLETALGLYYLLVAQGRLTLDQLIEKLVFAPRRIFNLPEQPETWVEFEPGKQVITSHGMHSRSSWTPFEGMSSGGCVRRVVLRGKVAFEEGQTQALPGSGNDIRTRLSE